MGVMTGVYYWLPKWTGHMYSEPLGKLHFWLTVVSFNLTFLPQFFLGLAGMPRRIPDYALQFAEFNAISTVGRLHVLGFSQLLLAWNVWCLRIRGGPKVHGAGSGKRAEGLEWELPSPPPHHSWETQPAGQVRGKLRMGSPLLAAKTWRRRRSCLAPPRLAAIGAAAILAIYLAWTFHQALAMMDQAQATPAEQQHDWIGRLVPDGGGRPSPSPSPWSRSTTCCAKATGFNGKTAGQGPIRDGFGVGGLKAETAPPSSTWMSILRGRSRVEFTGTVMPGLPWDMRPLTLANSTSHPGELQQVSIPGAQHLGPRRSPARPCPASRLARRRSTFDKIECFCFSQQTLASRRVARDAPRLYRQARSR
jgi:hypothetical protein